MEQFCAVLQQIYEISEALKCPICFETLNDPLAIECGHRFCSDCLHGCHGNAKTLVCPVCRVKYDRRMTYKSEDVVPSINFVKHFTNNLNDVLGMNAFNQFISTYHDEKEIDPFDQLIENKFVVNKPVRTYERSPVKKIVPFEDNENRERIIRWLHDNQNEFDRLTQSTQENLSETQDFELSSISQRRVHRKSKCRSLDIRCGVSDKGKLKRRSDGDTANSKVERVKEVEALQKLEDECLNNLEAEFIYNPSGWKRMSNIEEAIDKIEKSKTKKLKVTKRKSLRKVNNKKKKITLTTEENCHTPNKVIIEPDTIVEQGPKDGNDLDDSDLIFQVATQKIIHDNKQDSQDNQKKCLSQIALEVDGCVNEGKCHGSNETSSQNGKSPQSASQNDTRSCHKKARVEIDGNLSENEGKLCGNDGRIRQNKRSCQDDERSRQGDKRSCHGDKSGCHGDESSCHGDKSSCHGDKTSCQGDKSCCHGDRRSCQGDKRSCQGDNRSAQYNKRSRQSDDVSDQSDNVSGQNDNRSCQNDKRSRNEVTVEGYLSENVRKIAANDNSSCEHYKSCHNFETGCQGDRRSSQDDRRHSQDDRGNCQNEFEIQIEGNTTENEVAFCGYDEIRCQNDRRSRPRDRNSCGRVIRDGNDQTNCERSQNDRSNCRIELRDEGSSDANEFSVEQSNLRDCAKKNCQMDVENVETISVDSCLKLAETLRLSLVKIGLCGFEYEAFLRKLKGDPPLSFESEMERLKTLFPDETKNIFKEKGSTDRSVQTDSKTFTDLGIQATSETNEAGAQCKRGEFSINCAVQVGGGALIETGVQVDNVRSKTSSVVTANVSRGFNFAKPTQQTEGQTVTQIVDMIGKAHCQSLVLSEVTVKEFENDFITSDTKSGEILSENLALEFETSFEKTQSSDILVTLGENENVNARTEPAVSDNNSKSVFERTLEDKLNLLKEKERGLKRARCHGNDDVAQQLQTKKAKYRNTPELSLQFDSETPAGTLKDCLSSLGSAELNMDYVDRVWDKIDKGLLGTKKSASKNVQSEDDDIFRCDKIIEHATEQNKVECVKRTEENFSESLFKSAAVIDEDDDSDVIDVTPEKSFVQADAELKEQISRRLFGTEEFLNCTFAPPAAFQDEMEIEAKLDTEVGINKPEDPNDVTLIQTNESIVNTESLSPIGSKLEPSKSAWYSSTPKSLRQLSIPKFLSKKSSKFETKKVSITSTRLNAKQILSISNLTARTSANYSNLFHPNVTHLIVNTNESNRVSDHTIKYISCVAHGIWILNFNWIEECLRANRLVPEEPFEVLDMTGEPGPRVSRLNGKRTPLLKGYRIHAAGPFHSSTRAEVENVVTVLGGTVASKPDDLLDKRGDICLVVTESHPSQDLDLYEMWLETLHVVTVDFEWLSGSVGQFKLMNLRQFMLCSDDCITELGYPSNLVTEIPYSYSQTMLT